MGLGAVQGVASRRREGALVISAVEAPPNISPTGRVALLLKFSGGRCVRTVLSPGPQEGDLVLEGA